jgi:hypothetical protein
MNFGEFTKVSTAYDMHASLTLPSTAVLGILQHENRATRVLELVWVFLELLTKNNVVLPVSRDLE